MMDRCRWPAGTRHSATCCAPPSPTGSRSSTSSSAASMPTARSNAFVSLHYELESGASAETAAVGNEGVVGISLFMGGDTTPCSAVVKTAGHAYRLKSNLLKAEFSRGGLMQRLLLRYTQALMTQIT